MSKQAFLCEIGTEELPPKALRSLSSAFRAEIQQGLVQAGLGFGTIEEFASPRRLAVVVHDLDTSQQDSMTERFGPAIKAAFDEQGLPTKAAEGFARSCGVPVNELEQKSDGKLVKLYFQTTKPGQSSSDLLPEIVCKALAQLPIPKRMRWGSSREEFVRPAHWVIMLFGKEIIDCNILGIQAGNTSRGHRFMSEGPVTITLPTNYQSILESAKVIASFDTRKEIIREQINTEAMKLNARVDIDEDLLDEVTALVEWPVALTGGFSRQYLEVPPEALISSLKEHQKCFHLLDTNNNILPNFITISNILSENPSVVVSGNEKVIGPRLADAAFFFEQDKKQTLFSRVDQLEKVIFQQQLGTLKDKSDRVTQLAVYLAKQLGIEDLSCRRAAELGKCDLLSAMVGEFADLQGIMGYYYALHDSENEEVALALKEQYLPKFSGDSLPASNTGIILALAERIDTIAGLFAIGQPPSGSRDPFALRRSTIGLLRIIIEKELDLELDQLVSFALNLYPDLDIQPDVQGKIMDFIFERLRAWYSDQGISVQVFQAVDAVRPANPLDFNSRVNAVHCFLQLPESASLASANKRVANILSKLDTPPPDEVDSSLLEAPQEKELFTRLSGLGDELAPLFTSREFTTALERMASLQNQIDDFFDNVMVNTDNSQIRNNRLAILHKLRLLFLQIADISYLPNA